MKKILTLILLFSLATYYSKAQSLLAQWTFPTGTSADAVPDQASVNNVTKTITAEGGLSTIDFSKNGATTKAAQATGWDNGKNLKFWQIEINTIGYKDLLLSSKVSTGGTNPGPRDFKVQYKVGTVGVWVDLDSSGFKTANDWTTGVITAMELTGECNDQASVFIRWIMTSDTANNGSIVASTGICKIDDIFISGTTTVGIDETNFENAIRIYPNPSNGIFTILNCRQTEIIKIYNTHGQIVYECNHQSGLINVDLSDLEKGLYILKSGNISIQKIIIK